MQLAGAHAEERERLALGRRLLDLERAVRVAARPPEPDARREQELLPRVRADRVAEARLVVAALEPVAAGLLLVRPADRQLGADVEVVVDDRPVADGRPEHAVAAVAQRADQHLECLGCDDGGFGGHGYASPRSSQISIRAGPEFPAALSRRAPSGDDPAMSDRRFLVTGAYGCLGAWVISELLAAGQPVTSFDLSDEPRLLRLLLDEERIASIPHVRGDITDLALLERTLAEHEITNVIHLAALQVPFCRADPPLGASVNVIGTINVFEAARRAGARLAPVVYASSIAALDGPQERPDGADRAHSQPGTLYGVYKRAGEWAAQIYWRDVALSSVGLQPHTVYGVGRDQGLTSAATTAILAATAGVRYTIPYGGRSQLQHAGDVARAFIATSLAAEEGAHVYSLPGLAVSMTELVAAIDEAVPQARGSISWADVELPFPAQPDPASLSPLAASLAETPLREGVAATAERFRKLLADGRVRPPG